MLTTPEKIIFILLALISAGFTLHGVWTIVSSVRKGRPAPKLNSVPVSLVKAAITVLFQRTIFRARRILSAIHLGLFFGLITYAFVNLVDVLEAAVDQRLEEIAPLEWDPRPAVCVVMAAEGYPGKYETGQPIRGLEQAAALPDVKVFHAGTKLAGDKAVTAGGRVLNVTAVAPDFETAIARAYEAVDLIELFRFSYEHYFGAELFQSSAMRVCAAGNQSAPGTCGGRPVPSGFGRQRASASSGTQRALSSISICITGLISQSVARVTPRSPGCSGSR